MGNGRRERKKGAGERTQDEEILQTERNFKLTIFDEQGFKCWLKLLIPFPPTKFYDFVIKICLSTNDLTIVAAVSELLSLLPLSAQHLCQYDH